MGPFLLRISILNIHIRSKTNLKNFSNVAYESLVVVLPVNQTPRI